MISHPQLELLGAWKSTILLTLPDTGVVHPYLKYSTSARLQNHLINVITETGQYLLRHPNRAKLPLALGAIVDTNFGRLVGHQILSPSGKARILTRLPCWRSKSENYLQVSF
jgi:hypothetical protein